MKNVSPEESEERAQHLRQLERGGHPKWDVGKRE
jgi:hypothetical protein